MIALIDGDILVYRVGFALEKAVWTVSWSHPEFFGREDVRIDKAFSTKKEVDAFLSENTGLENVVVERDYELQPWSGAVHTIRVMLDDIIDATGADDFTVYLTGKDNYRNDVAVTKPYKGNRKDARKPEYYDRIRAHLVEKYDAVVVDGQEADDAMGIAQTPDTVICTIDKDLDMIQGAHYNFVDKRLYYVDAMEADLFFWTQMITGDSTDNIPGIPGAGPVAALAVMIAADLEPDKIAMEVSELYAKAYPDNPEEVMQEMAQLLWIRQEEGEVKRVTFTAPETH